MSAGRRPTHPMPAEVLARLDREGVFEDYRARPRHQQNDYLGWIAHAVRPETKAKRLDQMIDELHQGGVYMGMEHKPSRKH